jgi:hypothetical protein
MTDDQRFAAKRQDVFETVLADDMSLAGEENTN